MDDFDATNMCHGADKAYSIYTTLKNAENGNLSQKEEDQKTVYELVLEMYARGIEFLPIDL